MLNMLEDAVKLQLNLHTRASCFMFQVEASSNFSLAPGDCQHHFAGCIAILICH